MSRQKQRHCPTRVGTEALHGSPGSGKKRLPKSIAGGVMFTVSRWLVSGIAVAAVICSFATAATTQECRNRGQLDELYCDEDNDLLADAPSDLKKLRDP